jgi:2-polyprenyl-3-methyl-5-hydroxy-6-metoxy-1,4-benzoquinol methylase
MQSKINNQNSFLNQCVICQSTDQIPLYKDIITCPNCSHVYSPVNLNISFENLYSDNYFTGEEYANYAEDHEVHHKNADLRLEKLSPFFTKNNCSLFEIGCAHGFFLDRAKMLFSTICGIDISDSAISYAKRKHDMNVSQGDFLKFNLPLHQYNLFCLWDCIEHLVRPDLYLEKISRYQQKGDLVAISTGDIKSLMATCQGSSWRLIHPPTHIHYFSKQSITTILNKYGYEVIQIEYAGYYRKFDIILYKLFVKKLKLPSLYNYLVKLKINELIFYSNFFDIMFVIAKKT